MTAAVSITVYTREGCTLCDRAINSIDRVTTRMQFEVSVAIIDVDDDPTLRSEYSDRLPVIFIADELVFEYHVDEYSIENALRRAAEN